MATIGMPDCANVYVPDLFCLYTLRRAYRLNIRIEQKRVATPTTTETSDDGGATVIGNKRVVDILSALTVHKIFANQLENNNM